MKKIPKYEVVILNVAGGALAGSFVEDSNYKPDKDYKRVTGVAVSIINPNADVTAAFGLFGITDSTKGVQHDNAPIEQFQANAGVSPNFKYKDLNIPCDGRTVKSRFTLTSVAAQNYSIYVTYRVEDEEVVVATQRT